MDDDREIVLDGDHRPLPSPNARRGAALYDLLIGSWAVGTFLGGIVFAGVLPATLPAGTSLLLLWVVLVGVEAATGRSPGKHVVGIDVVRTDGEAVSLREAALRRPWGAPLLLTLGPATMASIGILLWLGTLLVMAVGTERGADRRGPHDLLAGTAVVDGEFVPRTRVVVVIATMVCAIVGLAAAAIAPTPVI